MKPTKVQFEEYVAIRDSGITNMFNVLFIVNISHTGLTEENCCYIMEKGHFVELADEYGVKI